MMTNSSNIPTTKKDCNGGKHFFIHGSEFCDRCDIDFDEWYAKVIEEVRKETCYSLLSVLDGIFREQVVIARKLHLATCEYIYDAVKDQCQRKRWID